MTRTARLLLATVTGIVLAVPTAASVASAAPASPAPTTTAPATTAPTTTVVRAGDSLIGIANRFGVRLSALLQANSLTAASVIHPGQTLVIPAGARPPAARPPAAKSTPTTASPTTTSSATGAAGGASYTVQRGDTLSGIARRHGVSLGALLSANRLTATSLIVPGRVLTLPAGASSPVPPTTAAPAQTPATTTAAGPATVTASPAAATSLERVLEFLRAQVGAPYRFFAAGPDAYDCSGLVVAAFRQVGVSLPHQSRAQAQRGTSVDWRSSPIMPGDLVFTSAINDPNFISHVGVALSSTTWIHAVGTGRTVSIGSIPTTRIMAVQRIALP